MLHLLQHRILCRVVRGLSHVGIARSSSVQVEISIRVSALFARAGTVRRSRPTWLRPPTTLSLRRRASTDSRHSNSRFLSCGASPPGVLRFGVARLYLLLVNGVVTAGVSDDLFD